MDVASLLHDEGEQIIVSASKPAHNNSRVWVNKLTTKPGKAASIARSFVKSGYNVYIKHASHSGARNKENHPVCRAEEFAGSRSFFIDVDVDKKQGYPTIEAANLATLKTIQALRQLGLPAPSLLQHTGGGLQLVWITDVLFPAHEWARLTGILYRLARNAGLKLDEAVSSIDRGVRLCGPEYPNKNYDPPRETKILFETPHRLDGVSIQNVLGRHAIQEVGSSLPRSKSAGVNDEYSVRTAHQFALDLDMIADDCVVLHDAIDTGGKDHHRSEWIGLLAFVSRAENEDQARAYAHAVSCEHPDYNPDEVDDKVTSFRSDPNQAYTTCAKFRTWLPQACQRCKYNGQVNSPAGIQGKKIATGKAGPAEKIAADAQLVDDFYFNSPAGVRRRKTGEEETSPIVWPNVHLSDLTLRYVDGAREAEFLSFKLSYNKGKSDYQRQIDIETSMMHNHNATLLQLSRFGQTLKTNHQKPVHDAMVYFINKMREDNIREVKYTRLGWTRDGKAFVLGNRVYRDDGLLEYIDASDLRSFDPKGDPTEYFDAVNEIMCGDRRPEAHAFLAASLGAVFLELAGATGIALNFYSPDSGFGKTTLSKVAGSIWGDIKPMLFTLDDTSNSVMNRIAKLNNLPGLYDEFRAVGDMRSQIGQLIFRLSANVEKSRMTQHSTLQERGDWRTMVLFSTNYSFMDIARERMTGGDAAIARVLDFRMPPLPPGATKRASLITRCVSTLDKTNGHVGHDFIQRVIVHRAWITKMLHRYFDLFMSYANKGTGDVSGRNHAYACAAMVVAAIFAKQEHLFPLDPQLVFQAAMTATNTGRSLRTETKASLRSDNILLAYLKAMDAHRITTFSSDNGRKSVDTVRNIKQPIAYEVDQTARQLIVDLDSFREWLLKEGYVPRAVIDSMPPYITEGRQPLGGGTIYATSTMRVLLVAAEGSFNGFFIKPAS